MGESVVQDGNAAIWYSPANFSATNGRPMGRQSAGSSFVRGFARHAKVESLYCFSARESDAQDFARQTAAAVHPAKPVYWLPMDNPRTLSEAGCLFAFHPGLRDLAFLRRTCGQRGFSLCGITHTLASAPAMDAIADLLLAPMEPWDALICTSSAGRQAVEKQWEFVSGYLAERLGAKPPILPRLVTIPLGINCSSFITNTHNRMLWRQKLGIAEGDVAVLYLGRLSAHAKAHPEPMYLALERAAQRTSRRLHLIQAGWFDNQDIERSFMQLAARLAPSVTMHFVTPLEGETYRQIWSAADFFLSLSDNIQETFGLTPVEAMAAGLPVVVSDWDGYRDTVRDGIDGFRIPTVSAPPGAGGDLAMRHALGMDRYDLYIGKASKFVAVDIEACAVACLRLAEDADMRRRMGNEGQRRAREVFDWSAIIPAYQALWAELAAIRRQAKPEQAPVRLAALVDPWRLDPFLHFAGYASDSLTPDYRVRLAPEGRAALEAAYSSLYVAIAVRELPSKAEVAKLLQLLAEADEWRVGDLLARVSAEQRPYLFRGLVWLAKYGVVILRPGGGSQAGRA